MTLTSPLPSRFPAAPVGCTYRSTQQHKCMHTHETDYTHLTSKVQDSQVFSLSRGCGSAPCRSLSVPAAIVRRHGSAPALDVGSGRRRGGGDARRRHCGRGEAAGGHDSRPGRRVDRSRQVHVAFSPLFFSSRPLIGALLSSSIILCLSLTR
jgi:hypothetical protein